MRNDLLQDAGDILKRAREQAEAGNDVESVRLLREATISIARFKAHTGAGHLPKNIRNDLIRALAEQKGSTVTLTKATVAALLEAAS